MTEDRLFYRKGPLSALNVKNCLPTEIIKVINYLSKDSINKIQNQRQDKSFSK